MLATDYNMRGTSFFVVASVYERLSGMVVVKDEVELKSDNGKIPSINQSISWITDTTTNNKQATLTAVADGFLDRKHAVQTCLPVWGYFSRPAEK